MPPPGDWTSREHDGVVFHDCRPVPGVRLLFFTRRGGVSVEPFRALNLSPEVGDDPAAVAENRRRAESVLGTPLFTMHQVHSDRVAAAAGPESPVPTEADAAWTAGWRPVGIKVADCLPVYVYDGAGNGVGIAHCGWRGTVAGLGPRLARRLAAGLGVPVGRLRFALGPCICGRCYEVGDDVAGALGRAIDRPERFLEPVPGRPGRHRLDLRAANRTLLAALGLAEDPGLELCSLERTDLLYSARGEGVTGRNLAAVQRI